jgi:hypothetical protein
MGRTLHYNIKPKNGRFTKKELEKLHNTGQIYKDKCKWSCETIDIAPYNIYPNWNIKSDWDKLNKRWAELEQQELHPNEISKFLVKEGIASFHGSNPEYGFYGFTKVGGNELNALQVVMALSAASRVVKNASIHIRDEGEFLKCPLIIEKDKAKPDRDKIYQNIAHLLAAPLFKDCYAKFKDEWIEKAKVLYELANPQEQLISETPDKPIAFFCRPVKAEDFAEHPEYGAGQIMAGFEGEYYGLSDKDSEAESYRMIAKFQKLLPKDFEIIVTPKIKTLKHK